MRRVKSAMFMLTVGGLLSGGAFASDDRIAVSGDGASLTGTDGGFGGSLGWLHNFDPDTLLGIAGEHQKLGPSQWSFGSLTGAMTNGEGDQRYTVSGEVHEGAGVDTHKHFNYAIEAVGLTGTYYHRLSAQLEDKQINVETTHGNLPKAGLSYLWNPHFQSQISYSYSFGGNLGTRLTAARIDIFGKHVNFLTGGAWGTASPIVLGVQTILPPRQTKEGYVGLAIPVPSLRSEVTLIGDYLFIKGGVISAGVVPDSTKWTGTLNWVFHVGGKK
ncbi:MAG TPA: hypothetical protein VFB37_08050 [Steroidobacteraceae bacterium]|nr:hypothetical protein [Steroidobacteraceae bacterium]